jgi:hypothetical protein
VGPERGKHLRNIAIVVLLALAVWKLPGGGAAGVTASNLLGVAFVGGLVFLGYRVYLERREVLLGLEERQRGVLYGSLALAAFALVATRRMWDAGGLGAMVWLLLLVAAGWGVYGVWRAWRAY